MIFALIPADSGNPTDLVFKRGTSDEEISNPTIP